MYSTLIFLHSIFRWVVLAFILYAIYRASIGLAKNTVFSKIDNAFRHWTATVAHLQLIIGTILYTQSPIARYFWSHKPSISENPEVFFYGLIHIGLMLAAIVLLTVGSALAKRKVTDKAKFQTMLIWFSLALLIILVAVPWPFSPLSARPYLRIP